MTEEKVKYKKIGAGDKRQINGSVPLLNLLKANFRVPLFHVSIKTITHVETYKTVAQFHVGYMYILFSKQNKTFRTKDEKHFTPKFDTNTYQAIKKPI